jgi:hypothetical protein
MLAARPPTTPRRGTARPGCCEHETSVAPGRRGHSDSHHSVAFDNANTPLGSTKLAACQLTGP